MRRLVVLGLLVLGVAVFVGAAAGPLMSTVEHPQYKVERSDGAIELRTYPSMNVATTTIAGSRGSSVNKGFRILADYIFGANEGAEKIAMTAPVMQNRKSAASKDSIGETGTWTIRFVMPRAWPMESLPHPRDRRVNLETRSAASFAVIRFSGFWRDALLRRKTEELEAYIDRNALVVKGEPIYAFYNPPWTLPFFRRNEIMIEVAPGAAHPPRPSQDAPRPR